MEHGTQTDRHDLFRLHSSYALCSKNAHKSGATGNKPLFFVAVVSDGTEVEVILLR